MNIVLLEPEIPHNTAAIGRLCVVTGTRLHLIKPLGFDTSEKAIRRTGLDYWQFLDVTYYENLSDFFSQNKDAEVYYATTKAQKAYSEINYSSGCFIMFGKESAGLPEELLISNKRHSLRIPMLGDYRSLNLSVSAGIILYEALRQHGFSGLERTGSLHRYSWNDD